MTKTFKRTPRAIDLYSGVGGWALGLVLAGIEVAESFEWWDEAARTHGRNFNSPVRQMDIRSLDVKSLPPGLDFVVGSPPCTQFSYSNRGGNGDIADGLRDICKFLEVVAHAQPRYWVMENVPRVAQIIEQGIECRGKLRQFRDLFSDILVVDMAEFGLPQGRKRMLAGNFPADLLLSYRSGVPHRTLGDVLEALDGDPVIDPIYGLTFPRDGVSGLANEEPLDYEEARMNREAKQYHPVYNVMQFPDELDRPSRTVTALCTRVSRESIVIDSNDGFRRLSLRERACLQGFPISFQFHGKTYPSNIKMIGNAVPPLMTYYLAQALQERRSARAPSAARLKRSGHLRGDTAIEVIPEVSKKKYSAARPFRAAIPGLRFGSGTRVELNNNSSSGPPHWDTAFYFGSSKDFRKVLMDEELLTRLTALLRTAKVPQRPLREVRNGLVKWLEDIEWESLQAVWCHVGRGPHPFEVVDRLGEAAFELEVVLADTDRSRIEDAVVAVLLDDLEIERGGKARKLRENASYIAAGLLVGSWFNEFAKAEQLTLTV
ncbi:MAG: DNA cytosine methyltransferase [Actinomycetota bacterium]